MCAKVCKQWIGWGSLVWLLGLALVGPARGADPGLVGWWTFDESSGTVAHDSSGNGNDGTLAGGVTWVAGKLDGAIDFAGTTGAYVSVPDAASLDITDAITMAVWMNPRTTGDHRWLIAKQTYGGAETYGLSFTNAGSIECGVSINNAWTFRQTTATVSNGTWTHVVGQYSPPFMRVFINGTLSQEWNVGTGKINANNNNLLIGKASHGQPFAGGADDLRIYSRALTVEEIQQAMRGRRPGPATSPAPAKAATDVPRDVTLSWQAGPYAATHDLYLGTTFADVNTASTAKPVGVLASQGQTGTSFTPGRLELGKTYYWRVDEVNKAPDQTVFKGDVWSFTTEPVAYPIKNILATTNATSDPNAGLENTVNNSGVNANDQHSTQSGDMWLGSPTGGEPIWLQYEFDRVYKLHELLVWNYNAEFEQFLGFGIKDVTLEYSADGVDWTVFGDVQFAQGPGQSDYAANTTVDFHGVAAQYVRLSVNSGWGTGTKCGLSEIRFSYFPVQAREPQPSDRATDVAVDTPLVWRAGRDAVTHNVYFGKDPDGLELVETTSEASFVPGALDMETTYYWRVDEVNEAELDQVWQGDVWTFSTPKYVVVDDFESYNDDDGNRIYQVWRDGEANGTGSLVGHLDSPFAEQVIVRSGKQSMPLFYNNTGVATAEAEYALSQNWTTSGIQSLSLYVYGDPNNTGQLYLKINDTKIAYDHPADVKKPEWQVWNIDLSAVAGNLSKVTMLTIGMEGAGASGVLYIDDIRLYPKTPTLIVPVQPGTAGLVACYPFDGNVKDSSGKGNDGTLVREPKWVPGKIGQAMDFDGMRDFVEVPDSASLDIADAITMAAWLNPRSTGDHRWVVAKSAWGATETYGLGVTNAGSIECGVSINNAWTYRQTTATISNGTWTHVVGQYSPPFMRVFINGRLSQEWNVGTSKINTNNHNLFIGKQTGNQFYGGSIDDLRFYNRALSPEEILGLAGETAPVAKPFE